MQWRHTHSQSAKIYQTSQSARKIMVTIFFGTEWPILIEIMEKDAMINAVIYQENSYKTRAAENVDQRYACILCKIMPAATHFNQH